MVTAMGDAPTQRGPMGARDDATLQIGIPSGAVHDGLAARTGPTMIWIRTIGWSVLALIALAMAVLPDLITLPKPAGAIVLDRATFQPGDGSAGEIALPHAIYPGFGQNPNAVQYRAHFELPAVPDQDLFLFIPSLNRRISIEYNGEHLFDSASHGLWLGPVSTTSILVRLPRRATVAGRNALTMTVGVGDFAMPSYLSRIYIGTEAALAPSFKLRFFLGDQLKTMALVAHLLIGGGLIFAYFFRPKDPLFAWLAAFNAVTFFVAIGLFIGWQPSLQHILPFVIVLTPASVILLLGAAAALVNIQPPKVLRLIAIGVTCALLPCALVDTTLLKTITAVLTFMSVIVCTVGATGLLAWGAVRQGNTDARLMLAPLSVMAWFAIRDAYVIATVPEHGFNLLFPYPRPLFLTALTIVLMRRMAVSLDQLDGANENLNAKLAEREAELAVLHRQERAKTADLVRGQERQRLTHDLHDGISGHLVSIIALSERAGDKTTEQAAREALSDLRLVIYSLDLGDSELPLALANFRERLVPQLHRLGVELDWSIAGLPDVSGVTPGNALAVLRILQEAITNALKHGPARKISIRGAVAAGDRVSITIENDGRAFAETSGGHGLGNMRRRAQQLHGALNVESVDNGVKITLLLPSRLPDFEDEA